MRLAIYRQSLKLLLTLALLSPLVLAVLRQAEPQPAAAASGTQEADEPDEEPQPLESEEEPADDALLPPEALLDDAGSQPIPVFIDDSMAEDGQEPAQEFPPALGTISPDPQGADAAAPQSLTPLTPARTAMPSGEADAQAAAAKIEALEFHGVQPGVSTVRQVAEAWGEPDATAEESRVLEHTYSREPFKRLQVTFHEGKVLSVIVDLRESFPPQVLEEQLGLAGLTPVNVADDRGRTVGQAYPERAVVFRFQAAGPEPDASSTSAPDPGASDVATRSRSGGEDLLSADRAEVSPRVSQIVLEPVGARPFVLRAEARLWSDYGACLQDLAVALRLDSRSGRAHWLRACVLADLARHGDALASVDRALELEQDNPEYRLTRAKILADADRYSEAVEETRRAIELSGRRHDVHARGLAQLGDQLASGPERDYRRAIDYHLQAIQVAEPLAADTRASVRRTAKETLIEANLAVAQDIAWGVWQQKATVVPKWLARAQQIAEESIQSDGVSSDYRLRVAAAALGACVGTQGELNAAPWAEAALTAGRKALEASSDPFRCQRLDWELGLALYDALQAFQAAGDLDAALEYGGLAAAHLERGAAGRQITPGEAYIVGRLYFRLGSIFAAHHGNHDQALAWYDKAVPLLERPVPAAAVTDTARQGETLVTVAVSYWAAGDRDKAVHLTSHGVELLEKAVEAGALGQQALSIPYSNLATMYRQLGHQQQAEDYVRRASKIAVSVEQPAAPQPDSGAGPASTPAARVASPR